jgi:hypothetical protein
MRPVLGSWQENVFLRLRHSYKLSDKSSLVVIPPDIFLKGKFLIKTEAGFEEN